MLTLRCTAKLLTRLKARPEPQPASSTTRLGDWYATILVVRPAHLVMLVNESTRLTAILPARELSTLAKRIPDAIAEVLTALGASPEVIAQERGAMAQVAFAKTASRSVLGTMNDFIFQLETRGSVHEDMSHLELAMMLNGTPVSPLRYSFPDTEAKHALGIAVEPGRPRASEARVAALMAAVMRICELKVTLRDIDPPIWRRIRVRSSVTLAELHDTLQRAMGWSDSHLHQFVANGRRFGRVDPEFPKVENENKVSIGELLSEPGDRLEYEYDFGDCWRHEVVLEQVLGSERDAFYPRLTDGARACPPEDCGGAAGYEHLLTALAHPMHPEHRELTEWVGGAFDAEAFDLVERNRALQSASRQTRR